MYLYGTQIQSFLENLKQFCIKNKLAIEQENNKKSHFSFFHTNSFQDSFHIISHRNFEGKFFIEEKNLTDELKIQLSVFLPHPLNISSSQKILDHIKNNPKDISKLAGLFAIKKDISSSDILPFINNITSLKNFKNVFQQFDVQQLKTFQNQLEEKIPKLKESPDYIKLFPKKTLETSYSIVIHLSKKELSLFNHGKDFYDFSRTLNQVFQELSIKKIFENDFFIESINRKTQYLFVSKTYDFYANQEKFLDTIFTILHHIGQTREIDKLMILFENNHILEELKFNDDELTVVKKVRKI